jgi:hypothetical protein
MNRKLRVWLLEDQDMLAKKFVKDMEQYFEIRTFLNFDTLEDALGRALYTDWPDVVLLDLYWAEDENVDRESVESAVDSFNTAIDVLKKEIPGVLRADGVHYLNELRDTYSAHELPILIYTRAGQYVLNEREVDNILSKNSNFILKKFSPAVTKLLIEKHVKRWRLPIDIFLSYAAVDANIASEISDLLHKKRKNLNVFMANQTLQSGELWNPKILESLRSAKVVVPLLTRSAISSPWVMAEAGACWALGRPICAGFDGIARREIPSFIKDYHIMPIATQEEKVKFVDAVTNNLERVSNKLYRLPI